MLTNTQTTPKKKRPYLYEVDLMRIFFIFGVLLNHTTTTFAAQMASSGWPHLLLNSTHLMIHNGLYVHDWLSVNVKLLPPQ